MSHGPTLDTFEMPDPQVLVFGGRHVTVVSATRFEVRAVDGGEEGGEAPIIGYIEVAEGGFRATYPGRQPDRPVATVPEAVTRLLRAAGYEYPEASRR